MQLGRRGFLKIAGAGTAALAGRFMVDCPTVLAGDPPSTSLALPPTQLALPADRPLVVATEMPARAVRGFAMVLDDVKLDTPTRLDITSVENPMARSYLSSGVTTITMVGPVTGCDLDAWPVLMEMMANRREVQVFFCQAPERG